MADDQDFDALYYPYIHIRDPEWLKRALLLFPRVARIVPTAFAPDDDPTVREYVRARGTRGPLLDRANLHSPTVLDAQRRLYDKINREIQRDPSNMARQFGREAAEKLKTHSRLGFQIRMEKDPQLIDFLEQNGLAWIPAFKEPDDPDGYVEVHPRMGEAIMATIAVACARDEGLQIVTHNDPLHRCLADNDLDGIFDTWIGTAHLPTPKAAPTAHQLAIAVIETVDVTKITPKRIVELHENWEPRQKFLGKLRALAGTVPDMQNAARAQERLVELVDRAIREWERDKISAGSIFKDIFPSASANSLEDWWKEVHAHLAVPAVVGAAGATQGGWTAFGTGVAIGFVAEGVRAAAAARERAKDSPYRYLSLIHRAGGGYRIGR